MQLDTSIVERVPRAVTPSVAAPARPAARPAARPSRFARRVLLTVVFSIPVAFTFAGWSYYTLSRAERLRHPLHAALKASGVVGLSFGVAGLALFLFMWLYPLRKKFRWLSFTGAVSKWLNVHIVVGLVLPLLVAVHAGWRFDGLIGLGYAAMVLVSMSGIVGRYLYSRIPRTRNGVEMSRDEVANERRTLITRIAAATRLDPAQVESTLATDARAYRGLGPLRTLLRLAADDWARDRALRALRQRWERTVGGRAERRTLDEAIRLARREMALSQQARMLEATHSLFGLWHVLHRPVAITALLAILVHVAVALAVGAIGIG